VCVGIQPQTGITIEIPAPLPNATTPIPSFDIPTASPTPTDESFAPEPFHGTPPPDCVEYYQARADETCDNIVTSNEVFGLTRDRFFALNPVLGGVCNGLWVGYFYCTAAYDENQPPLPPVVTVLPSPVLPGTAANCIAWHEATDGDECWMFPYMFGTFSEADFLAWNPSIGGAGCEGFEIDHWYCVAVPGSPTTRTAAPTIPFTTMTDSTSSTTTPITPITSSTTTSSEVTSTTSEAAVATPQPIQVRTPVIAPVILPVGVQQ
jgi:hypothetical protein